MEKNTYLRAVIYILLASLFFAANSSISAAIGPRVGVFQKMVISGLVGTTIFGYILIKTKDSFLGSNPKLLLVRVLLGFTSTVFVVMATTFTQRPLFELNIVTSTNAIFTVIVAILFLKEKVTLKQVVVILVCFVGVYVTIRPGTGLVEDPYILLALGAAVLSGSAYVCVRALKRYASANTVVFGFSAFTMLMALPIFIGYELIYLKHPIADLKYIGLLLIMGLSSVAGQYFLNKGYRMADASKLSIFAYSQMIFTLLFSVFFQQKQIAMWSYIGAVLIVASGIATAFMNNKAVKKSLQHKKEE